MNLVRILKKNTNYILFFVIAILFISIFYKTNNQGFQNTSNEISSDDGKCNFNYCSGKYEVVKGQCVQKCSDISANYIPSTSDPLTCKEANTRNPKTFSRDKDLHKKKNLQNNNLCECPRNYSRQSDNTCTGSVFKKTKEDNNKCSKRNGFKFPYDTESCYYCYEIKKNSNGKNLRPKPFIYGRNNERIKCFSQNELKYVDL